MHAKTNQAGGKKANPPTSNQKNTVAIEITSKSERKEGIIPKTLYKAHLI